MEIRYDNDMFQNRSVSIKNIDEYIYSTIISAYAFDLGNVHKQCNSNFDKDLSNARSLRGEISKMSASIGRCNVSNEECGLFKSPYVTNITNIDSNLEVILGPDHVK